MFELKISAASPAELLTKLTQAVEGLSLTGLSSQEKGEAIHKEAEKLVKDNKEPVKEEKEEKEEPKGRTSSRRNTKKEETAEEDEPKGRRSRTTEKKSLVDDNEEQAILRAQLVTDLQDLADVEEAHGEVADALKRVGAKTVKEIASDSLGDFNEDIQGLIGKYFE